MKRISAIILTLVLLLSMSFTAFAAVDGEEIDVIAKYISEIDGEYSADVVQGSVTVEVEGVSVNVTGISEGIKTIVVVPIPQSETEAIDWFEDMIEDKGTEPHPFMILTTDKDGNEENANGVTVTMDIPAGIEQPIIVAVNSNDTENELTATVKDGKITFEADGSDFYVIAEKKTSQEPSGTVTVPVSGDDNTVHADATIDGDTAKMHDLDFEEIDHIVGDHVSTGTVEIDFTELDTKIVAVILPVTTVEHIVEAAEEAHNDTEALAIHLSNGIVTLDDKTMRVLVEQAEGNEIKLVLDSVGETKLNEKQKDAVTDMNVYGGFEAYMLCVASNKRISDFEGGVATLSVPFTVPDGMSADKFTVWYVADDGTTEKLETWHENDMLHWSVGHFSDFIVTYDGEAPTTPPTGDNTMLWLWIVLAVVAMGTIFFIVFWRRRRKTNV